MGNQRRLIKKTTALALLSVALFSLCSIVSLAQVTNPKHTTIAEKYDSGKIEAALSKAEKLMDNDKTKKDPEAYLWASMCYLELSKSEDPKIQDYYKSAFKNAQKYAAKAVTKDKEGDFIRENWEYIDQLKAECLKQAEQDLKNEKYRKANYTFKQWTKIDENDDNIRFLKGATDLRLNNQIEASRQLAVSMTGLNAKYRDLDYRPDPRSTSMVQSEIIFYLDQLINTEQLDSARKVVFSARLFFPLDKEVSRRYEELVQ